jgi:acetyl esterase/lipase
MNLAIMLLSIVVTSGAFSQDAPRPAPVPLWPSGAPGAKGTQPEDIPTISVYRPDEGKATGAAIVVCPGGGYGHLADHEGHTVALWLNKLGITAAVLKYRLGPRYQHPAMLQDAQRAIRVMRADAAKYGIDPQRIGIMGFSAGGHLASTAGTHFDSGSAWTTNPVDRASSRPDLLILGYPVITMTAPFTHQGSRKNLLGESPAQILVDLLSNEKQVTAATPPTFIFHTEDDGAVPLENALMFAAALRAAKVPYEMHIYEHGRHGVGLAQNEPALRTWPDLLASWLGTHGFTTKK